MLAESVAIAAKNISKCFYLHSQGTKLLALEKVSLKVSFGKCLAINGSSGAGKSTLLRCLYGNYLASCGEILIKGPEGFVDLVKASPRQILKLRSHTLAHVSQFLRVIPRVSALDIVAAPIMERGISAAAAREKAKEFLERLSIPTRLFHLSPMTFSGGERQRVNIARGLAREAPILLLDEPTASLDYSNRQVAIELINEAKARGVAIVGIFHDRDVRDSLADSVLELSAPNA